MAKEFTPRVPPPIEAYRKLSARRRAARSAVRPGHPDATPGGKAPPRGGAATDLAAGARGWIGSWGIVEWGVTAALVIALVGGIHEGTKPVIVPPDPHFGHAKTILQNYEAGKPVGKRNYFDQAYSAALSELSLVAPDSGSSEEARIMAAQITANRARLEQALDSRRAELASRGFEKEEKPSTIAAGAEPGTCCAPEPSAPSR